MHASFTTSEASPRFPPPLPAFETNFPLWRSDNDVTRVIWLNRRSASGCNLTSQQVLILYLKSSSWVLTSRSCFPMKSLIPRIRTSVFQLSFCFWLQVFEGSGDHRWLEVGDGDLDGELLCFVLEVTLGPFWDDFLFLANFDLIDGFMPIPSVEGLNLGLDNCI